MKEYILCAAIWVKDGKGYIHQPTPTGRVYCGHRHHNILELLPNRIKEEDEQGFITNTGRYVNREEALLIAEEAGQIREKTGNPYELYSEDLY